jgi:hypothetical protein
MQMTTPTPTQLVDLPVYVKLGCVVQMTTPTPIQLVDMFPAGSCEMRVWFSEIAGTGTRTNLNEHP